LIGHDYLVRRTTAGELQQSGAFRLLADEVAGAKEDMGRYGIAMTVLPDGDFLLLASQASLVRPHRASVEELQDHDCKLLFQPPTH
jgi:CDP-diacylglycerol pyrophosphatase